MEPASTGAMEIPALARGPLASFCAAGETAQKRRHDGFVRLRW